MILSQLQLMQKLRAQLCSWLQAHFNFETIEIIIDSENVIPGYM